MGILVCPLGSSHLGVRERTLSMVEGLHSGKHNILRDEDQDSSLACLDHSDMSNTQIAALK